MIAKLARPTDVCPHGPFSDTGRCCCIRFLWCIYCVSCVSSKRLGGRLFILKLCSFRYRRYFWCVVLLRPSISTLRINLEFRRKWVQKMHMTKGMEVAAVQTLRNLAMSATLLATASVLAASALVNVIFMHSCDSTSMQCIKVTCLAVAFLVAFLFFAWSIRALNHASILSTIRPDELDEMASLEAKAHSALTW